MYAELSVIVNGAVDSEETYFDETLMHERIRQVECDARGDGYLTEVFILWHDHEPSEDGEDVCVQYLTDLRPAYAWNLDGPGTGPWSEDMTCD